ncbi:MAG: thermonuclease family protein [Nanoarchaeota archaeon]|nr:thermonuclease family protein [Nanoarchaeota archaeon]
MKKEVLLLMLLIIIFVGINYSWMDTWVVKELSYDRIVVIDRIVDGDTIKAGNESIRLLGINTPEKKEYMHDEAQNFLTNLVFNKTVSLKYGKDQKDIYGRTLAYISYNEIDVNKEMILNGYANAYFPSGRDVNYNSYFEAWNSCVNNNVNLCEKSVDACSSCIKLKRFGKEERVIFENVCNIDCNLENWNVKDEGRKNYVFGNFVLESNSEVNLNSASGDNNSTDLFWNRTDYVWTDSGDTIFLRDDKRKLVLWERY